MLSPNGPRLQERVGLSEDDSLDEGVTSEGEDADETRVDSRAHALALEAIRQMSAPNADVPSPPSSASPSPPSAENLVDTLPPPKTALSPGMASAPPITATLPAVPNRTSPPVPPLAGPPNPRAAFSTTTRSATGPSSPTPASPAGRFPATRKIEASPLPSPPPLLAYDEEREDLDVDGYPLDSSELFGDLERQHRGGTALIDLSRYPGTIWGTPPGAPPGTAAGPSPSPLGATPYSGPPHPMVSRAPALPAAPSSRPWPHYALIGALVIFILCMAAAVGYAILGR
jgi:hypothetical protein